MVSLKLHVLEKLIVEDTKLRITLISYFLILIFYINLNLVQSFAIGVLSSALYFLINGTFLAHVFFEDEPAFFRTAFGALLLIMLLGFVGWLIMIIYNLNAVLFSVALLVTASISSLLNRRMKHKNAKK